MEEEVRVPGIGNVLPGAKGIGISHEGRDKDYPRTGCKNGIQSTNMDLILSSLPRVTSYRKPPQ